MMASNKEQSRENLGKLEGRIFRGVLANNVVAFQSAVSLNVGSFIDVS